MSEAKAVSVKGREARVRKSVFGDEWWIESPRPANDHLEKDGEWYEGGPCGNGRRGYWPTREAALAFLATVADKPAPPAAAPPTREVPSDLPTGPLTNGVLGDVLAACESALEHLHAIRTAGDVPVLQQRYSFTNEADAPEVESAIGDLRNAIDLLASLESDSRLSPPAAAPPAAAEGEGLALPTGPGVWLRKTACILVEQVYAPDGLFYREIDQGRGRLMQSEPSHVDRLPRGHWCQLHARDEREELERVHADYDALENELSQLPPPGLDEHGRLLRGGPEVLEDLRAEWSRLRLAIAGHFGPNELADYSPVDALERACDIEMRRGWHADYVVPKTIASITAARDEAERRVREAIEKARAISLRVINDNPVHARGDHSQNCNWCKVDSILCAALAAKEGGRG